MAQGYQISQFDVPLCLGGHIEVELGDGSKKRCGGWRGGDKASGDGSKKRCGRWRGWKLVESWREEGRPPYPALDFCLAHRTLRT